MTPRTNLRLASAVVAGVAVLTTSLAALVLPSLARADEEKGERRTAVSATSAASPRASTAPREQRVKSQPRAAPRPSARPSVRTTNAPGSTASFDPAQEWVVLDPRFNKNELNLLAGEAFVLYADVLHSRPLAQNLRIELQQLSNVTCKPQRATVPKGAASGLQTFVIDCVVTKGQSRISGLYRLVQADGSVVGEGVFGASPNPERRKVAPGGGATSTAGTQQAAPNQSKGPVGTAPGATARGTAPAPTAPAATGTGPTPAASSVRPDIRIERARFTPARFPVRTGQQFRVDKDITVANAPLHSTLTMRIDRQQNLECTPQSAQVPEQTEGTRTLTFTCTITGTDRGPVAWYSISLADGTKLASGKFGLDAARGQVAEDDQSDDRPSRGSSRNTSGGGLAETGGPAIGVALAAAAVSIAGAGLIRRRR